jgi:hypothetical protein
MEDAHMSRTHKQRKYDTHKNNLHKEYKGITKLDTCCFCGADSGVDHFGYRNAKGIKAKRRRYLRHCLKHDQDMYILRGELYASDNGIRTLHMGSETWRDIGQTLYGKALPPLGLVIVGIVIMDDMEGGALLYNEETGEFFMGSDGDLTRALGKAGDSYRMWKGSMLPFSNS